MVANSTILFKEEQHFRNSKLWYVLAIIAVISFSLIIIPGVLKKIPKDEIYLPLLIMVIIFAVSFFLYSVSRLETVVTTEGIYYRWLPITGRKKFLAREQVRKFEIRKRPWMQYGFRLFPGYGWMHTVKGAEGVQFYLKTGKRIFIGTENAVAFKKALEKIIQAEGKIYQ